MIESSKVLDNLRECQKDSIKTIYTYLKSRSKKSCLISLPTGAGKTGVICLASHNSKCKRVLVLTHRRSVCDQLARQLEGGFYEKVIGANFDKSNLKSVYKTINNFSEKGIYCTTVQMITKLDEAILDNIKNKIDLLIFDEGHAEPASKWCKAVRKFECKKIIITATPYRNDLFSFDIDVNHHYIYTFRKAVESEIIVKPTFEIIKKNEIAERIKKIRIKQPNAVCIVKCDRFKDVQNYYKSLATEFNTIAIHDQFSNSLDKNTLQNVPCDIDKRNIEVVIHQRKLDEGVDLPQAKILILTYSVRSGRELVQTVGRIVRSYEDYKAYTLVLDNNKNIELWDNFKEFDEYLSNKKNAENFVKTLDTSSLIKSYINEFPAYSYYDSGFKKKFDFENFNPIESLEIPLASVCFYIRRSNFDLTSCLDRIYWEFNRQGALSKYDAELGIVTSITFNNSKFLKNSLFFEPSLEVMIVKELGQDYIAIFDSQGRTFSNNEELGIGRPINMDKLFRVVSEPDKTTQTKQANTRALQKSDNRPEGISYKGNLEAINHPASNSSYAITTGVFDSIDSTTNQINSSYYLGIGSGRISDQKKRRFSFNEYTDWLDNIYRRLDSKDDLRSSFIRSFAKVSDSAPTEPPSACILDFSEFENLYISYKDLKYPMGQDYIYLEYNQGISLINICNLHKVKMFSSHTGLLNKVFTPCIDNINAQYSKIKFSFDDKSNLCLDNISQDLKFINEVEEIDFQQVINEDTIKLLYNNGISFLKGEFFEVSLPTESGELNKNLMSKIYPLDCLLKKGLSEKDETNTTVDNFGTNSIFYEIDKLSNVKKNDPRLSILGSFYEHLPNVDLILCTDLGAEPADFILSSPDKLVMAHVKCGASEIQPQSSAGAIAEVGSQAIKNIDALIGQKFDEYYNQTILSKPWKIGNNVALDSRIRLYNKQYGTPSQIQEILEEIKNRRNDILVQKEMWIIVGNSFSAKHFKNGMENISSAKGTSKQAYQLIDTWLTQLSNHEIDLKLFVSP